MQDDTTIAEFCRNHGYELLTSLTACRPALAEQFHAVMGRPYWQACADLARDEIQRRAEAS